ncbi:molecular chaperone HtpG [Anaerotruncus massiliensis (ex Liu et al. 2021)]|uniref:Chaperone protein HtpG n=2 Tax=Anaerotruncus TaxID=244127 RepID=A0A498CXT3_9FIRM|nr:MULTISPECIES: molecular chaperone HtpG [Anaerotruncus]MBC3937291.1 molecular chaperone HtpG [Anaerotruncus massiliensis (ex Togo et al. 2019)]RLL14423.1 molecular chaperone HtpG [Anaerotruncus massiliensis (ex Liu et al. 2021)]
MRTKQFKAESKRLLELMINSIYTHREIFLRELISNASDAIDKLYYHSLSENLTGLSRDDFSIELALDKDARTLTITDNGCGMTKDELESNLGTIAKSGSLAFKQEEDGEHREDIDIIGQFGVGFYSAFMVASRVTVYSRPYGSDEAWKWESRGVEGYTIEPCEMDGHGTKIVLTLKENEGKENYDEFLDPHRVSALVKRYSDYIRYPIRMDMPARRLKEGCPEDKPEYEDYTEHETLNSMVPIWKKNKSELKDEDYNNFYKEKYFDFEDPALVIHSSTEGAATYNALLFIPARAPFNYYSRDYEKGLQLYASGVLIMDRCADLLPDCFSFVKGLVDSQDLSLNISREMLQHDRQLKVIAGRLEKKIHSELLSMLKNDREKYEKFWKNFGLQLKFGVYNDYGAKKDLLQDLLLFHSSSEEKLVTLSEYVGRMKESQKYIYYACGETVEKIGLLPQTELLRDQGYEILYLTDDVDEFALRMLFKYEDKEFKSVADKDLGLETEEEKEEIKKQNEENKDLLGFLRDALDGKVKEVRLSSRLKSHPVCLSSDGMVSLEMEKVLSAMPGEQKPKAERVLEVNASHPVFAAMRKLYADEGGRDRLKQYASLLYSQALLIEGMSIDDPVAFSNAICDLMSK